MAVEPTPSSNAAEYFARVDADFRKERRAKADAEHSGFATNSLNIFT